MSQQPPGKSAPDAPAEAPDENHLIAERRAKLGALRAQGPAYPNEFRRDALAADLLSTYHECDGAWFEANPVHVRVGGRMMFKRLMGKASFAKLADRSGAIQLFLQESTLGAGYEAFKDYDVGDILGRPRPAVPHQDRRTLGARHRIEAAGQVAPPAARQVARAQRHRDALPACATSIC